jgi:hypothetical protein
MGNHVQLPQGSRWFAISPNNNTAPVTGLKFGRMRCAYQGAASRSVPGHKLPDHSRLHALGNLGLSRCPPFTGRGTSIRSLAHLGTPVYRLALPGPGDQVKRGGDTCRMGRGISFISLGDLFAHWGDFVSLFFSPFFSSFVRASCTHECFVRGVCPVYTRALHSLSLSLSPFHSTPKPRQTTRRQVVNSETHKHLFIYRETRPKPVTPRQEPDGN